MHPRYLSLGLKNSLKYIPDPVSCLSQGANEECFQYNECDWMLPFIEVNKPVYGIKYRGRLELKLETSMVNQELLEILRCPNCVREKDGLLDYVKESWLICRDCGRKYPIRDDIPVMLIDEGDKWVNVRLEELPVPPPDK